MDKHELPWPKGIPGEKIGSRQIHVWRALLNVGEGQRKSLLGFLSDEERERARRFHFEKDQQGYIAGRGMLRQILGLYLKMDPRDIQFGYNPYGKPLLKREAGREALGFNLSHSKGVALYAFTPDRKIGIDVERIRKDVAVEQITKRFFSPGEIASLKQVPQTHQHELFFQYWTRKEAFIKAIGRGVSFPMEQVDVSRQNGRLWSSLKMPGHKKGIPGWQGRDLFPGQGYAAAIVVEEADGEIICRDYAR